MVEIVEPTRGQIRELARNLRADDRAEIEAFGVTPMKALLHCYNSSLYRRAALHEGHMVAAWGTGSSALCTESIFWLLTSPLIEHLKLSFLRIGRSELTKLLDIYPRLVVYVGLGHKKGIALLRHLDFTFEEAEAGLLRFSMERKIGH